MDTFTLLFVIFQCIIIWWPLLLIFSKRSVYKLYHNHKDDPNLYVWARPPWWVFVLLWTVLFACITAAAVYYTVVKTPLAIDTPDAYYQAIQWLIPGNLTFNYLWVVMFFVLKLNPIFALLELILLLFPSTVVLTVLYGLQHAYVSMALFIPYGVWLIYAFLINVMWFRLYLDDYAHYIKGPEGSKRGKSKGT
jgi:tryptophan-rich sensory protein